MEEIEIIAEKEQEIAKKEVELCSIRVEFRQLQAPIKYSENSREPLAEVFC